MPKVTIWRDDAIESEFDPGHRDWRIGRSETNDITLLDPRKSVSRFHAELREEHGRWVFIDLNSQNGSWKDGQRVNRLVLEHGNEVLFGDYKLAFEDVKVAPPPVPAAAGLDTAAVAQTADVAIPPDQTLLMPGAKAATPATPAAPPPPVMRAAVKAKAPRKGVNPVILLLFLIAMLGAVAAVAWRLLTDSSAPAVAESTAGGPAASASAAPTPEPSPAPAPPTTPPPADTTTAPAAPPSAPSSTAPAAAPTTGAAPAPTTSGRPAAATPAPPAPAPAGPVTRPAGAPAGGPAGAAAPRPKRTPPAAPKESPVMAARYDEGRRALDAGRFAEAQRAFEAVLAQQPGFRDAAALLDRAKQGQAAARTKALADADALASSGEWSRAVAAYERAGAADQAAAVRAKMHAAGDDAYRKARQFDARNRPGEAITWYQRAVEWLADADARKATARERLAALKGGGA